MKIVLSKW